MNISYPCHLVLIEPIEGHLSLHISLDVYPRNGFVRPLRRSKWLMFLNMRVLHVLHCRWWQWVSKLLSSIKAYWWCDQQGESNLTIVKALLRRFECSSETKQRRIYRNPRLRHYFLMLYGVAKFGQNYSLCSKVNMYRPIIRIFIYFCNRLQRSRRSLPSYLAFEKDEENSTKDYLIASKK